jgi:hypothetical protein
MGRKDTILLYKEVRKPEKSNISDSRITESGYYKNKISD